MMSRIVDANVVLHGRGELKGDLVTVPEVYSEIKSQMGQFKLQNMKISQSQPSEESLRKVKQLSDDINSPTSETDENIVALGLDTGHSIVSDDRALQNLALHLETNFEGFLDDPVEEEREWKRVCENCGNEVESPPCSCGSNSIRRKPRS